MNAEDVKWILGFVLGWCIFITMSFFNQRQEIAILKKELELLRNEMAFLRQSLDHFSDNLGRLLDYEEKEKHQSREPRKKDY